MLDALFFSYEEIGWYIARILRIGQNLKLINMNSVKFIHGKAKLELETEEKYFLKLKYFDE